MNEELKRRLEARTKRLQELDEEEEKRKQEKNNFLNTPFTRPRSASIDTSGGKRSLESTLEELKPKKPTAEQLRSQQLSFLSDPIDLEEADFKKQIDEKYLTRKMMGEAKCCRSVFIKGRIGQKGSVREYTLSICRDFTGAYGLFLIEMDYNEDTRGYSMTKILTAHPMYEKIDFRRIAPGDYEMSIFEHIYGVVLEEPKFEILEKTLLYIRNEKYDVKPKERGLFSREELIRRINTFQFISAYARKGNPVTKIQGLVMKVVHFKGKMESANRRWREIIKPLLIKLIDPKFHDLALNRLLSFTQNKMEFKPKEHLKGVLTALKIILTHPNFSQRLDLYENLCKFLWLVRDRHKDTAHSERVDKMIRTTQDLYDILKNYQSRGFQPRVRFDRDEGFRVPPGWSEEEEEEEEVEGEEEEDGVKKKKKKKKKKRLVGLKVKRGQVKHPSLKMVKRGVNLGCFIYTIEKNVVKVVTNNSGMCFPCNWFWNSPDIQSRDYEWLFSLGSGDQIKSVASQVVDGKGNPTTPNLTPFQAGFMKSFWNLSSQFGMNLGNLYPLLMDLGEGRKVLFMVYHVRSHDFHLPRNLFVWKDFDVFEHDFAQNFYDLSTLDTIEVLTIDYGKSKRFLYNMLQQSLNPKEDGFYLMYLKYAELIDGYAVQVDVQHPTFLPSEFVSSQVPTEEELKILQKIRFNETFDTILTAQETRGLDKARLPIPENKTYMQDIFLAYQRLKARFPGVRNVSRIYDHELIWLDKKGKMKGLLFVESCSSSEELESLKTGIGDERFDGGGVVFLPEGVFESVHYERCVPEVYELFVSTRNEFLVKFDFRRFNDDVCSVDEFFRLLSFQQNEHIDKNLPIHKFVDMDRKWMCMRWPVRARLWEARGGEAITSISVLSGDEALLAAAQQSYSSDFVLSLKSGKASRDFSFLEMRKIVVGSKTWELIDQRFTELEKEDKKKLETEYYEMQEEQERVKKKIEREFMSRMTGDSVDCNIEDIRDIEILRIEPTSYEYCKSIVDETIEIALVETVDKTTYSTCKSVLDEIITKVEEEHDEWERKIFLSLQEKSFFELDSERQDLRMGFLERFKRGGMKDTDLLLSSMLLSSKSSRSTAKLNQIVGYFAYDGVIQDYVGKTKNTVDMAGRLLQVVTSIQELLEVVEMMSLVKDLLKKKISIKDTFEEKFDKIEKTQFNRVVATEKREKENMKEKEWVKHLQEKLENPELERIYDELRKKSSESSFERIEHLGKVGGREKRRIKQIKKKKKKKERKKKERKKMKRIKKKFGSFSNGILVI